MVGINHQYSVDSDVCFHRPSCRLLNPIGGGGIAMLLKGISHPSPEAHQFKRSDRVSKFVDHLKEM